MKIEAVLDAYKEYLGEPNGHLAHKLLHTTYTAKRIFRSQINNE